MEIQQYLNTYYPSGSRHEVRELIIANTNGSRLRLSDLNFINVERLMINSSALSSVSIRDLLKLKKILIRNTNIDDLAVRDCNQLETLAFINGNFSSFRIRDCVNFQHLFINDSRGDSLKIRDCNRLVGAYSSNSLITSSNVNFQFYQANVEQR